MGVSKVMRSTGETIMDISGDTVTAGSLLTGYTAHGADGNLINGAATIPYNVNLLDNADWYAYIINQRSNTTYSGLSDAYGIDRWRTTGSITVYNSTSADAGYVALASGCVMKQRIEILPSVLIGKTVTAAVDVGGTIHSDTVTFPSNGEETVISDGGVTVAVGIDSGTYELCGVSVSGVPYIKITASSAVNVRRVWLEIGSVCHMETTPPKNYAENLAVCQRYFIIIGTAKEILGFMGGGTNAYLSVAIPTRMRIRPSLSIPPTNLFIGRNNGSSKEVNNVTVNADAMSDSEIQMSVAVGSSSGLSAQTLYSFRFPNNEIWIIADL